MMNQNQNRWRVRRTCSIVRKFGIAACGILLGASTVQAQSLFERSSLNQIEQYRDYAARHPGDLLTVVVNESTELENRDQRLMDKAGSSSNRANIDYGFGGDVGSSIGSATFGHSTDSGRNFRGDTEFRSERELIDRFTVVVQAVQPNGNLIIAGERIVSIQGDVRKLKLTGVVRQYDVLPNNLVPSQLIANLDLKLEGAGPEQAYNKQGWFSRRMNRLWPF